MSDLPIHEAYTRWAATYDSDRNLTRDLDHHVATSLLAGRWPATILEIGCGTGKNTGVLLATGAEELALDFSPGMLAQARARHAAGQASFRRADLTRPWPVAAGWAELVVGNLVLEHIADLGFIFAQAAAALRPGGQLIISELHPVRQYAGSQARFRQDDHEIKITAYVHHISSFLAAAATNGLVLADLREWWHPEDSPAGPPRLISFGWTRPA